MIYLYTYTVLCNVILYRFLLEFSLTRRLRWIIRATNRALRRLLISHPRAPCVRRSPRRRRLG